LCHIHLPRAYDVISEHNHFTQIRFVIRNLLLTLLPPQRTHCFVLELSHLGLYRHLCYVANRQSRHLKTCPAPGCYQICTDVCLDSCLQQNHAASLCFKTHNFIPHLLPILRQTLHLLLCFLYAFIRNFIHYSSFRRYLPLHQK
jgi:hypothetical protein